MGMHRQIARPQRVAPTARRVSRALKVSQALGRTEAPVIQRTPQTANANEAASTGFQPDPYLDYGRFLTAEGGILLIYKDLDERLRQTLWRLSAWSAFTGSETWFLLHHSPARTGWLNFIAFLAVAVLNWLIVRKPVEVYRQIEIRPDCLIMDGTDLFWRRWMEVSWPAFKADENGNQVLCGIYGARFIEYLTARRFDEQDRMPEVFAAHLQDAMQQLWSLPQV
jgi:hypothetical protein